MAIKATVKATAALEDVPLDITLRMTVKEWRALQMVLPEKWPGWEVFSVISAALNKVEASVSAIVEQGADVG